ncbi:GGDEF domain-containing protein [Solidesulfovibrio carbinolicus]|uniref:diguanylate cyclase n=1 Tax=Solidesulfovibrio carbinolicus TaxID=296842 RepID=A0A4P6HNB5_9BACT|nr:diguanylate cyclase [Solidesulfovibrio carbinolicus]QAZ68733.1 GGDEF domain-containing protein [Solidesulfovibrio carbinolicus]
MATHPRLLIGFRTWLMILSVFSALPMIAFSITSLSYIARGQYVVEAGQLRRAATILAHDLDGYFAAREAMLRTLAASDAAMRGDIDELYRHARRIAHQASDQFAVALVDRQGRILFHTMKPYGDLLGETSEKDQIARVLATGEPSVSPAYNGPVSRQRVVALDVPMSGEMFQRYCLRAVIAVADVEGLLVRKHFSPGWMVAYLDQDKLVAAARADAAGRLLAMTDGGEGGRGVFFPRANGIGDEELVETAVAGVGTWGWRAAVSVPESTFARPLRALLLRFVAAAAVCLGIGLVASYYLAKRLGREMGTLLEPASARGGEQRPCQIDPGIIIREVGEVRACLLAARDREEQAKIDSLTELPGRALFWEMARELERQSRENTDVGLAVMFIDLDGFKHINDQHGHDRGDWVLRRTAEVLRETVRDKDVVGRLGGDEFAVCLAAPVGQVQNAAAAIAERVVAGIGAIGFGIGCSIGVSVCLACTPSLSRALALADQAMYEAKRLGKNRYVLREDTTLED